VEIEAQREQASGKIADGVSIRYRDEHGVHTIATASGAQGQMLGMSIYAGVADLERMATGAKKELFYIDEGFGSLDDGNLEGIQSVLRKIAQRFEKVIYITHIEQLKAIADMSIRAIPSAEGSRIEVA
jgi:exonuclease SbcC